MKTRQGLLSRVPRLLLLMTALGWTPTCCRSSTAPLSSTPTITTVFSPSATPTLFPTLTRTPTSTELPTPTPTSSLLVSEGTPIPPAFPAIAPSSADLLSGIAEYKTPPLVDFKWHPTRFLLAAATTDSMYLIDPFQAQNISVISLDEGITSFDFSPDGRWLVTGHRLGNNLESFYGKVQLWVAPDYLRAAFFGDNRAVTDVQFSRDGKTLAIAYSNISDSESTIQFRDAITWELLSSIKTGNLVSMGISPDATTLITIPDRYSIKVWDLEKKEVRYTLPTSFSGAANCLAISPDGSLFVTGHYDRSVILWDLARGERLRSMEAKGAIGSLAFHPDGQTLASGTTYQSALIQIWSVESGERLRDLEGHPRGVNFLAFAANGQLLASASYDGTIRLWGIRP
ncbi:MAG: WD40 repeat domain-containing protein [Anaerolineales bacterium]|nr:WD40 repeat domain-containing protein [Anaerolineales bacterium]MDW8446816.1 WD40 repeat domain-containing protein [Anaerolineales bacterium]